MSDHTKSTDATFDIDLAGADALLEGTGRFDFTKTWAGGLDGTSRGVMLSAGDPATATAGYVALEVFDGAIDGRSGTVAFQQFGTMQDGATTLHYVIVPGSGTGELASVVGSIELEVDDEGRHGVTLLYAG